MLHTVILIPVDNKTNIHMNSLELLAKISNAYLPYTHPKILIMLQCKYLCTSS